MVNRKFKDTILCLINCYNNQIIIDPAFLYTNYRNLRYTRKIFLETVRFIIFLIGAISSLCSQHYNVYVLGLHAADGDGRHPAPL